MKSSSQAYGNAHENTSPAWLADHFFDLNSQHLIFKLYIFFVIGNILVLSFRLKRGSFNPIHKFTDIGKTFIAYRIYIGMSQAELAEKLEVSEAQISIDERHEYNGATTEKIERVMNAMSMVVTINIEISEGLGA